MTDVAGTYVRTDSEIVETLDLSVSGEVVQSIEGGGGNIRQRSRWSLVQRGVELSDVYAIYDGGGKLEGELVLTGLEVLTWDGDQLVRYYGDLHPFVKKRAKW